MTFIAQSCTKDDLLKEFYNIVDAENFDEMRARVDALSKEDTNKNGRKFISSILSIFTTYLYKENGKMLLTVSESSYRPYLLDECLKIVSQNNDSIMFVQGEIELKSMTKQLQKSGVTDKRYCYKTVGICINSTIKDFEILLMEVTEEYSNCDQAKISFDHFKASFGLQSMLTSIAQEFSKSSWDTFKRLKLHFIHANGSSIRHWSICAYEPKICLLIKEQRCKVPVCFEQRTEFFVPHLLLLVMRQ